MAQYKKRPATPQCLPGLFDAIEEEEELGRQRSVEFAGPRASLPPYETASEEDFFGYKPKGPGQREDPREEGGPEPLTFDMTPLEAPASLDRLTFISFGSGSSGNSAYVGDEDTGILIDAGVDAKHIEDTLQANAIPMERIKAIVLTHDHADHVRSVYALCRRWRHIAVCSTPRTLAGMLRRHNISVRVKDYHRPIFKEHPFRIGAFELTAFEVMHDGSDNAGYYLTHGRHAMTVATDLGCVSERADHYMRLANYLVIEANYDARMLAEGRYPEHLKGRIRSATGHLDNAVTARYLADIYSPRLRRIFLCHLSHDNNTPAVALGAVREALLGRGLPAVGDGSESPQARQAPVQLMALPRFEATPLIVLR